MNPEVAWGKLLSLTAFSFSSFDDQIKLHDEDVFSELKSPLFDFLWEQAQVFSTANQPIYGSKKVNTNEFFFAVVILNLQETLGSSNV